MTALMTIMLLGNALGLGVSLAQRDWIGTAICTAGFAACANILL